MRASIEFSFSFFIEQSLVNNQNRPRSDSCVGCFCCAKIVLLHSNLTAAHFITFQWPPISPAHLAPQASAPLGCLEVPGGQQRWSWRRGGAGRAGGGGELGELEEMGERKGGAGGGGEEKRWSWGRL